MAEKRTRGVSQQDTDAAELLLGASRMRLLRVLLLHVGPPLHLRAIARSAKVALGLLQRELRLLERIGLLERSEQARTVVFNVRRAHPLVPTLVEMVIASGGGWPALLARELADVDRSAGLYLERSSSSGAPIVLLIVSEIPYERWAERTLLLEPIVGKMILLRVLRPGQLTGQVDQARWEAAKRD